MNPVLREILDTGIVWDGNDSHDNMAEVDCALITEAIKTVKRGFHLKWVSGAVIRPVAADRKS
jgi:hypothetical protein